MIGAQIWPLKIVGALGAGGMGRVYLAEHVVLRDRRAIKLLDPQLVQHGAIAARFIDEARARAALRRRGEVLGLGLAPPRGRWGSRAADVLAVGAIAYEMAAVGWFPWRRAPAAEARYRLGERLGTGGMAEVFLGTHLGAEGFERRVAIKRVLARSSGEAGFEAMFTDEARLLCRLVHPNIVGVLDFSRDADGRLFLVMEYVHGRDLAALAGIGPIPPSTVIYIVAEILRGLAYAHEVPDPSGSGRGLVHRDVTPRNVLLSYEGEVKVADFGLARMRDASGEVRSEAIRGTPPYMSPEQWSGAPLDGRSDLRAVGAIAWELLANRPMYRGTPHEVVSQILFKEIDPPSVVARGRVPPDLEAVVMKLLARDRDERYPTAQAALDELLGCEDAPRDGRGELARLLAERFSNAAGRPHGSIAAAGARGRGEGPVTATGPAPAPAALRTDPVGAPRRRRTMIAALGVVALVIALGLLAWFVAGPAGAVAVRRF